MQGWVRRGLRLHQSSCEGPAARDRYAYMPIVLKAQHLMATDFLGASHLLRGAVSALHCSDPAVPTYNLRRLPATCTRPSVAVKTQRLYML